MPYRSGNYSFVIDSTFRPYSFDEMLKPLSIYADAYKEMENTVNEYMDKANKFAYLAKVTDDDDPAKKIYEGYANDLAAQAADLSKNGLTIGNRRALMDLKRRYSGEMGLLEQADERLRADRKYRDEMRAKGVQMFYANENPKLSDYLYEQSPNLYGISADDLYAKGAAAGKAFSSRMFTTEEGASVLNGYYKEYLQKRGVDPSTLNDFQRQMVLNGFKQEIATLPELQQVVLSGLKGLGVFDNLSGRALEQAQLNYLNGVVDGTVYDVDVKPYRNEDKLSPESAERMRLAREQFELSKAERGITGDSKTGFSIDPSKSLKVQEAQAVAAAKTAKGGTRGAGSNYGALNQQSIRVSWKGDNPSSTNGDADNDIDVAPLDKEESYVGVPTDYDDLPQYAKNKVDKIIGNKGDYDNYIYFFRPYEGGPLNDTEASLDIIPRKVMKDNSEGSDDDFSVDAY